MPILRQTNFSGGELDPLLHGRTDLPIHGVAARTLKNFFVDRTSAAHSRPGTTMVRATKYARGAVRLVPFTVADDESYVLEVGERYIRFHRNGATVMDGGAPLELSTLYIASDLAALQWAQVGEKLTITSPSQLPQVLQRDSSGVWTISAVNTFVPDGYFVKIGAAVDTRVPALVNTSGSLTTEDSTHFAREWVWKVTMSIKDSTGRIFETWPFRVVQQYDGTAAPFTDVPTGDKVVLYTDRPVTIRQMEIAGSANQTQLASLGWEVLAYNYYRGRGDLFGFVGTSKTTEFVDDGIEPDYTVVPPAGSGTSPTVGYYAAGIGSVTGFFQERRVVAGFATDPAKIYFSEVGAYENFDKRIVPAAGQSLEFELAAHRRERIRSLAVLGKLLIGTDSSVWVMGGAQGDPLDYDSVETHVVDEVGVTSLQPLIIDGCALFVRTKGKGVRAIVPNGQGGFVGRDISSHSQHLFTGQSFTTDPGSGSGGALAAIEVSGGPRSIIDWCYAEDPYGVAWAVRADGVLLSLNFKASGTATWTRHKMATTTIQDDTVQGSVKAICSVPETSEDAVYLVVERMIGTSKLRFIERMNRRVRNTTTEEMDADDDAALDCCLRYSGLPVQNISGLSHLNGQDVWVTCVGESPMGPYRVSGGTITLDKIPAVNTRNSGYVLTDVTLFVGLPFQCDLETLDVATAETRAKQKTTNAICFEVNQSKGLYFGQTFDNLVEWQQREVSDSYGTPAFVTDVVRIPINNRWDQFARACLRQVLPLPVTVLGISREVDFGGP